MHIAIDSSLFVAILAPTDKWHLQAVALLAELNKQAHTAIYFDCVLAESLSTAVRRLQEQKRAHEIPNLFTQLALLVPHSAITWIFGDVVNLYPEILGVMQSSGGDLNFHDALIAIACRERSIAAIASFDEDFDQIHWLRRLATPADVAAL